jgi:Holliday junction resolvase
MPKYNAKVDSNQPEIVKAFRNLGFSVFLTHTLGRGFPDIVVGKQGRTFIIEIKDGAKSESKRKLTPAEQEFKDNWRGQYDIIESIDDVVLFNARHFGA